MPLALFFFNFLQLVLGYDWSEVQVKIIEKSKEICDKQNTVQLGDHLSVHYTGRFDDEDGDIFEESKINGQVFKIHLEPGRGVSKGHFFSDHSTLTNRPDAHTQLLLMFLKIWAFEG